MGRFDCSDLFKNATKIRAESHSRSQPLGIDLLTAADSRWGARTLDESRRADEGRANSTATFPRLPRTPALADKMGGAERDRQLTLHPFFLASARPGEEGRDLQVAALLVDDGESRSFGPA